MDKLKAPANFKIVAEDEFVKLVFDPVDGADGYKLSFYNQSRPDRCFKERYAIKSGKVIRGFKNGKVYLASVCAYKRDADGNEIYGESTEKTEFVTMSKTLKAQNKICLKAGETGQIKWEYQNTVPEVTFTSESPDVVSVDESGALTALKKGDALIKTSMADGQSAYTSVSVDRNLTSDAVLHSRIVITGDLMCSFKLQKTAASRGYDFTDAVKEIKKKLSGADVMIGTLETVLYDGAPFESEEIRTESKTPNCNSPSTFIKAVKEAGYNYIVTANNHNADCGLEGLKQTVSLIKQNGIRNCGTFYDNPVYFKAADTDVALISLSMIHNGNDGVAAGLDITNPLGRYDEKLCQNLIREAKANGAKLIIVIMHWGNMNSHMVSEVQKKTAKSIAEAGADIIVGSHPHLLQMCDVIHTSDDRDVPCAYSLGNFLTTMNELPGNRDGAAFVIDLARKDDKLDYKYSYIPFYSRFIGNDLLVEPVDQIRGEEQKEAAGRMAGELGDKLPITRPLIRGIGSVITRKILASLDNADVDDENVLLSVPSFFGANNRITSTGYPRVDTDICKSFWNTVKHSLNDYILIDFYTCASLKLCKNKREYFTYSEAFRKSAFYKNNTKALEIIDQPEATDICLSFMERFADELLARYDRNRIILVRNSFPPKAAKADQLRNSTAYNAMNARIKMLEDKFIALADPVVIDISGYYFRNNTDSTAMSEFESYYFDDIKKKITSITNGDKTRYFDAPDPRITIERVIKYYDNMKARNYFSWLCTYSDAADKLIMYTSREFIASHRADIVELRTNKVSQLGDVKYIPDISEECILASSVISDINSGIIPEDPQGTELAFKYRFNITDKLAKLLAKKFGMPVSVSECPDAYRLRNDKDEFVKDHAHKKYHIDIWGSCITRTAVALNEDIIVNNYVFKQPPVLAYNPPAEVRISSDLSMYGNNEWRKKTMIGSLKHDGLSRIKESSSKWMIVDLYDLICETVSIGNDHFEIDDFIKRSRFFTRQLKGNPTGYLFNECDPEESNNTFIRFAEAIKEKYGENIILVIADLKNTYIDLDGSKKNLPNDPQYKNKVEYITYFEDLFIQKTGCLVLNISKKYDASDAFPLGGAHIVHYEHEFYEELCKLITDILSGQN